MRTAPLLSPWPGPFGGVPPFDKIKTKDFTPALEAGMEQTRKEIAAIAGAKEPAPEIPTAVDSRRRGACCPHRGHRVGHRIGQISD
jgi:peptidyl-dipeptidase Dcp